MVRKLKSAAALALLMLGMIWPSMALAETRAFDDPMYGRHRLDYCRFSQDGCGIEAALHFCRREGYEGAESYRGPVRVRRTMRVGNRTTCRAGGQRAGRGGNCEGFSQIVCERPDPVEEEETSSPRDEAMEDLMRVEVTQGPFEREDGSPSP